MSKIGLAMKCIDKSGTKERLKQLYGEPKFTAAEVGPAPQTVKLDHPFRTLIGAGTPDKKTSKAFDSSTRTVTKPESYITKYTTYTNHARV